MTITIGADPEFFLGRGTDLRSSIDLVGGSKAIPKPLGRDGFFVQEDNVAVEFNIPPAETLEQFVESIEWSLKTISNQVKPMGLTPLYLASALFPPNELRDARAQMFGCDPDYNAWTSVDEDNPRINPRPQAAHKRLRSCGGHVHVGYPQSSGINRLRLIRLMDLYLGVPAVFMDSDVSRRELYGKPGAFRPTDYGVEYRVLSNFWLKSVDYMKWVYEQTMRAVLLAQAFGPHAEGTNTFTDFMETFDLCDDIQTCINKGDTNLAHILITKHHLVTV